MTALPVRIIDAITQFVEDHTELPTHTTVKYRRAFLTPKEMPCLNVYPVSKAMAPRGTNNLDAVNFISVSWFESGVRETKQLKADPNLGASLLTHVSMIEQTLMDLWTSGWPLDYPVDAAYECQPVSVDWQPPFDVAAGLVEGYSVAVQVMTIQSRDDLTV
jgi:hypothetical protein